jgi:hypothetical protein
MNPDEKMSLISLNVDQNPLKIKSNIELEYSLIEQEFLEHETITSYKEQNPSRKNIDILIESNEVKKKIFLIIYKPESNPNSRILEISGAIILKIEYEKPQTPAEETNPPKEETNTPEEENNQNSEEETHENTTPSEPNEEEVTDNNYVNEEQEHGQEQEQMNNEETVNEIKEEYSFDYLTLGIVLGCIFFVILIGSIIACVVNQNRKNKILEKKLNHYKKQNTMLSIKSRSKSMNESTKTNSTDIQR